MRGISFIILFIIITQASQKGFSQGSKLALYNNKVDKFWHSNLDSAFYYTEQAYKLSKGNKNIAEVCRAKANKGIMAYTNGNYKTAIVFYDSALKLAKSNNLNYVQYSLLKSTALRNQSNYKQAIVFLKNEIKELKHEDSDFLKLNRTLLSLYVELGRINEAQEIINAIESLKNKAPFTELTNYYMIKMKYYGRISEFKKSDSLANVLLTFFDSTNNKLDKSSVLLQLGSNAMEVSNFDTSFYFLKEAKKINESVGYGYGIAETNRLMGSLYSYLNDFQSAAELLYRALGIFEQNQNRNEVQKIYYELGWIYYSRELYKKAEEYLRQSIAISEEIGNLDYLGKAYNALGNVNYELNDYQESLNNYLKSSNYRSESKDLIGYAASKFNAAIVYDELGMDAKAIDIYLETYLIDKQLNNQLGMAIGEYYLARFYLENDSLIKAKKYIDSAVKKLDTLKIKNEQLEAYSIASDIYEADGDLRKSNFYLKSYLALKEAVFLEKEKSTIDRLEAKYKLDNYEQQIKILNLEKENSQNELSIRENTISNQQTLIYVAIVIFVLLVLLLYISFRFLKIRSKTNKKLTKLYKEISEKQEEIISQSEELHAANEQVKEFNTKLEQKVLERTKELAKAQKDLDLFFYKASHDFRGPLTTFMGISEVANMSISNPEALELFGRVEKTARKLDKMVRKLQFISLLNAQDSTSVNRETIKIDDVFQEIKQEVHSIAPGANVKLNCESNVDMIRFFYEHLVIMLEVLIENGIIFNNKPEPVINVDISVYEQSLIIKVKDNGNGIRKEEYTQIFEMFHRNSAESKGNGLGLFLLQKLVTYLEGEIRLTSEIGKGTEFTLKFAYI